MNINIQGNLHKGTAGAAGYDLMADKAVTLAPGARAIVPTGVYLELPATVAALVVPRSGLAAKHGITVLNAPGLVDPDYRGEVGVILHNTGSVAFEVQAGDRIAQLLFTPFLAPEFTQVTSFSATERGAGGFGSTGKA